jgi:hypothetical protein
MTALRFLYYVIYVSSRSKDALDLRFNPAVVLVLLIQPPINSALGLALQLSGNRNPLIQGSPVLYAKYDAWTYLSIFLAAAIAWQCFDKRRSRLIAEYSTVRISTRARWLCILFMGIFIVLNVYLYTVNQFLEIVVFGATLVAGHILIGRIGSVDQRKP